MASGRPLTTTSTTGVPVATTASSSSCWRPRNPSVAPVAELAGRRVVGQPGALAERRGSRRRTRARASTAAAISSSVPVGDPGAAGVEDLGADERGAEGVEDRPPAGQLVAGLDRPRRRRRSRARSTPVAHLAQRLHVDEVAVVAEQVAGAVGDRPDDRDAPAVGRQRQDAVVLDEDERALGERRARPRSSSAASASSVAVGRQRRRTGARTARAGTSSAAPGRRPRRAGRRRRGRQRAPPRAAPRRPTVRGSSAVDARPRAPVAAASPRSAVSRCAVESISTPM